jgi:hypothetical protein
MEIMSDFSLTNLKIYNYLSGHSELVPSGELMYLHTHFVEKNFLSEIEVLINEAAEVLSRDKTKMVLGLKLQSVAQTYATLMNSISDETSPEIMKCLREIYQICKVITK